MTLNASLLLRAAMLNGVATFMNDAVTASTLVIRQTNLVLVTFSLNTTPFATALSDSIIITTPPITNAAVAVLGNANNFTLNSEAVVLGLSGTISGVGGGGDIQVPSVTIATTTIAAQRLNTFIIRMASTGALSVEASFTFV